MSAACGAQVYSNQASDNYGNTQGELQVAAAQADYNAAACDVWLCKGYKFADNAAHVQAYAPGQTVPMVVDIRAPHTGTANVSIVDTGTNQIVGRPLVRWEVYAANAVPLAEQANNTRFEIEIPADLGGRCETGGECVIQWWWDARSIDQTYEACVDFTVGAAGSTAVSSAAAVAVASSTAVKASSAVVVVSSPSATVTPTSVVAAVTSAVSSTRVVSTPVVVATSSAVASSTISTSTFAAGPTTLVTAAKPTTAASSTFAASTTSLTGAVAKYYQCGGLNYIGATTCVEGTTCKQWNPYYYQCV
ncbi:uncharacterized protein BDZ99DRAFT_466267 [Mytilinidion resinicola]|uniref:CBM1 domain-containing protein n=1 Tax=Mytilinidion resinicola TaxID=574789 RepID=A0A6A6YB95_9PEZI|nr:uncharacterized protein BDZ99DRAFT_466267 [Mytilinidion resinicola]KAF2805970.1 hypothetical protein BDZ99DRAFT_466267 [Mytilinidion resinicola]